MHLTTIGMDLAKNVFQLHGADDKGRTVLKRQLRRAQVLPFFANLAPCKVGMEACGSAHYWARKLQALGHTVQLIAPQYVKPFVKRNKNDAADAEAICEAVSRPNMAEVPIKNAEQQAILSLHRARQGSRRGQRRRIRSGACWPSTASRFPRASRISPSGCRRSSRMARTICQGNFGGSSSA